VQHDDAVGQLVADGTPADVMASAVVQQAYLGSKSNAAGAVHV
jgi:ABC-type lipopolysaccharide export system ATPase subunit